jgi:hypothetical protein
MTKKTTLFFHSRNENGEVTFAGRFDTGSGALRIGVAKCSKGDHFCKKTGRTIAIKRLNRRRSLDGYKVFKLHQLSPSAGNEVRSGESELTIPYAHRTFVKFCRKLGSLSPKERDLMFNL